VSFANANGFTDRDSCYSNSNTGGVLPEIFKHRLANLAEEVIKQYLEQNSFL